ncbi:hypothetical protein [Borreliella lusitaniae]|uniref:hypothetical protein n=1 Tax=Borreliella lusitaniae TaxID=100177 RepID=UPI00292E1AEE|nr:hypothetical protein [Borreliella lusitaniae]WNY66915.1 hypothetical protein QIA40_02875 [Borreliella lusitaniae]
MKEEEIRKTILIKRLVKYFFDELKYRMKLPCLKINNKEINTKYILLNLFRKIANLSFNKQYEIEEHFALEVGERVVLVDSVLIKRIDHERCVIAGIVEVKTDQVDLDYEFNRFFLQDKQINVLFWQPKKVILKQDDKLFIAESDDIFNFDNDFNLPKVKAKLEEFINIFLCFFSYRDALFEYNKVSGRYSWVKKK